MNYARIESGIVRELIDFDPTGRYHHSLVWVPCPVGTEQGDLYDGTTFSKPPPPPPPTPDQLREQAKAARAVAVAAIDVTVTSGKTFDGDEASQTRMARAIIGMQAAAIPTITWTLADNTIATVTVAELTEALILAGQQQAALWPIP